MTPGPHGDSAGRAPFADGDGRAPFADRRLLARAGVALLLANARYWSTVAPLVRAQLARWERRAAAIPDPRLRTPALAQAARRALQRAERGDAGDARAAGTAARAATRAIVALQVMYDYLDVLTEQPLADPTRGARRLFTALLDALTLERAGRRGSARAAGRRARTPDRRGRAPAGGLEPQAGEDYYRYIPEADDGGYLGELVRTVRLELATAARGSRRRRGRARERRALRAGAGAEPCGSARRDDRRARAVGQARSGGGGDDDGHGAGVAGVSRRRGGIGARPARPDRRRGGRAHDAA